MQLTTDQELKSLTVIAQIVAFILQILGRETRPGMTTLDIDRRAAELLFKYGADATPRKEFNFPGRLCVSVNDEAAHGVPGPRVLRPGDLVKMDLTADRRGFVADAARMVVVGAPGGGVGERVKKIRRLSSGSTRIVRPPVPVERPPAGWAGFEKEIAAATRLASACRQACHAAVAAARPGMRLSELGAVIEESAGSNGYKVVKDLTGHGVGHRMHEEPEVPNYRDPANKTVLKKGMVLAIEPILTKGNGELLRLNDGWTLKTRDGSLAGHYEETILIGSGGAEVLTRCAK